MAAGKLTSEEAEEYKMEIKTLEKNKEKISLLAKGIDASYANTIRRLIIDEVPTMAIKFVTFDKNTSALYDEMIAHRFGLVVLKTDLESYNLQEKCKCNGKGCSRCQAEFSLKAVGPCNVYAEEIKFKDQKIKAVYPKTLILKLAKGQLLSTEGIATLGKGKHHTKYAPALVYYRSYPIIKINQNEDTSAAVKVCPTHVFRLTGKKANVVEPLKCILCMACVDACNNAITVEGSKTDFLMFIESYGQLKHKEIVETAISVMNEKLDDFGKALKAVK
ncbi:DNA-directed RNA polymerase subunit D [Candidatus Woesearchaeota archaeon]|nr:DNA-directed RNA polymerase subunit D [Candidatus Woesearchaeota archaeon]